MPSFDVGPREFVLECDQYERKELVSTLLKVCSSSERQYLIESFLDYSVCDMTEYKPEDVADKLLSVMDKDCTMVNVGKILDFVKAL